MTKKVDWDNHGRHGSASKNSPTISERTTVCAQNIYCLLVPPDPPRPPLGPPSKNGSSDVCQALFGTIPTYHSTRELIITPIACPILPIMVLLCCILCISKYFSTHILSTVRSPLSLLPSSSFSWVLVFFILIRVLNIPFVRLAHPLHHSRSACKSQVQLLCSTAAQFFAASVTSRVASEARIREHQTQI